MNKRNNLIIIIPIIIAVLLIAVAGFAQVNASETNSNNGEYEDNYSPTGDRTFVRLKRTANDKVDVYLELADTTIADGTEEVIPGASVASFQIGLDIEMDLEDKETSIKFEFDPSLNEETYCKLMKTTWADKEEEEGHTIVEQLNIYYTGTKELNDAKKLEGIKVGTISFEGLEEDETVSITPNANFTAIASIGHSQTPVNIKTEDSLKQMVITANAKKDEGETGGNTEGGNQNNEVNGETGGQTGNEKNEQAQKPNTNSENKNENSSVPNTGDIALGTFITLAIASLIGIVAVLRIRKINSAKSVKNSKNRKN